MAERQKSRQKVSLFSLHYPPDATGIAPYAGALAQGLTARGYKVEAHVAHPFYPEWRVRSGYGQWKSTQELDGILVRRYKHYVPRPPRGVRRLLSELSFGIRLLFSGYDRSSVVISVTPALFSTAAIALRLRLTAPSVPLIVWVQDLYALGMAETQEGSKSTMRVMKFVEQQTLKSADRVVVIHSKFAEYIQQEMGVCRDRIDIVRNWTHLKETVPTSREEARDSLGWERDVTYAVHTGNMGAKQGLENIVEAARLADNRGANVRFVLVGDGGEREKLERVAHGVERIDFLGQLSDTRYRYVLAAADCLIVNERPGVAAMAVPSKLTSYFDAGRPIIAATAANGITASEVRAARAGLIVSAGKPEAVLEAALRLAGSPAEADAFGRAGRRYRLNVLGERGALEQFERIVRLLAEN